MTRHTIALLLITAACAPKYVLVNRDSTRVFHTDVEACQRQMRVMMPKSVDAITEPILYDYQQKIYASCMRSVGWHPA